jgi:hypothetical protein
MALSAKIENGELVIRLPLEESPQSNYGKTQMVASSHGTLTTTVLYKGRHLMVSVRAFIDLHEEEWRQRARASMLKTEGRIA